MIFTVTFNPAVDYLVYLDSIRVGEVQRTSSEAIYFSGKGINVSKVLNTLGVASTAMGFLAGFTGRAIADALLSDGIASDFCFLPSGNTRINVKLRHGAETDLNAQGPDIPDRSLEELYERLDTATEGDVVIIAGSAPKQLRSSVYREALCRASARGARTVLDADGALLRSALAAHPTLIKPNREELSALLGREIRTDAEVLSAVSELQEMGARSVLVSLGGDGAIFVSESGEAYRMGVAEGRCVNSIGAGDSMLAGFASAYFSGRGAEEALLLGTACGAATAFSEGLATREEIDRIYRALTPPKRIH